MENGFIRYDGGRLEIWKGIYDVKIFDFMILFCLVVFNDLFLLVLLESAV